MDARGRDGGEAARKPCAFEDLCFAAAARPEFRAKRLFVNLRMPSGFVRRNSPARRACATCGNGTSPRGKRANASLLPGVALPAVARGGGLRERISGRRRRRPAVARAGCLRARRGFMRIAVARGGGLRERISGRRRRRPAVACAGCLRTRRGFMRIARRPAARAKRRRPRAKSAAPLLETGREGRLRACWES